MYWKTSGPANTLGTIKLALETATTKNIKDIVVASCSGQTALLLAGKTSNLVCVSHAQGFVDPGTNEMSETMRSDLITKEIKVLTTTHLLSGAERGISRKFGGAYPIEIMAHTLRMLGQGVKVCVEIAVMALDAGLVPFGKEIIAIGGSSKGADTAVIIRPGHASNIFDTYISEIICKPK
ncbi:MAG: pyruvate kinase, alpha/beta domain [Firmicutes bacterium]|nr:pyruvate kinase, alpha/beta domain [Bacillota bacterium]